MMELLHKKIVEEMTNRGETMNQRICLDAVRPQLGAGLNRAFEPYQKNNLGNSQESEKKPSRPNNRFNSNSK